MSILNVDFSKRTGIIKPMHSVNNGPAGSECRGTSNLEYFKEAKIPYIRNHDASFYAGYGGEHTVDVHAIFRNFDADENNPESYSFEATDNYMKRISLSRGECFYRLGSKIEHETRYGTYPPKDFLKWARICEHIIRHYNEGWANGYHYNIKYWEIWNEPDCSDPDGNNPCWQGTFEEFCEFFTTSYKYIKSCFPHLKIGGPAFTSGWRDEYNTPFFESLKKHDITLDFFSFHGYAAQPGVFDEMADVAYGVLEKYGCAGKTELILNEWNYVHGWIGDEFKYSVKAIKGIKGASFIAAVMCVGQKSKLDQMMYYDARPCAFNGMFSTDLLEPLKGYYPFKMYSSIYDMKNEVFSESDDKDIYCVAAECNGKYGVMFTHYSDDDTGLPALVKLSIDGIRDAEKKGIKYYLLDESNDIELVKTSSLIHDGTILEFSVPLYSTYLIIIE